MQVETTQEFVGNATPPKSHADLIYAFYLHHVYLPENDQEKEICEKESSSGVLLVGNLFPSTEDSGKKEVFKFKPFLEVPVYCKKDALSFWKGKIYSSSNGRKDS